MGIKELSIPFESPFPAPGCIGMLLSLRPHKHQRENPLDHAAHTVQQPIPLIMSEKTQLLLGF